MADTTNLFEKIRNTVDIVDVISRYVDLEPKGKNYFGVCPFHSDHSPSMSVSRDRRMFTCWSCKATGDVIKFVSDYEHMGYMDAAIKLASEFHIDVSEYRTKKYDKRAQYYDLMGTTQKFYRLLMNNEEYSRNARKYILDRGLSDTTINEFEMGLSPKGGDDLVKQLEDKGFLLPDIEANSLANGRHDFFQNRIMVPIKDEQGRVIAFGGRIYEDKDKEAGINKYQNSKDTPLFRKGETVFNIDKASKALRDENFLIINEGYMDVIESFQNGIRNAVAIMGTAMTIEQATTIKKYTSSVVICLDGDKAGMKGVMNCTERLDDVGVNYSIVILKENLDPDEYLRKYGRDDYLDKIMNHRIDKMTYLYELTKLDYPVINTFNMNSFQQAVFDRIKNERSRSIIETFLRRLSTDMKVSYESVLQDFQTYTGRGPERRTIIEPVQKRKEFEIVGADIKAEHMAIDYALTSKKYYRIMERDLESRVFLKDITYRTLFIEIGDIYDSTPDINVEDLIQELKLRDVYSDFEYDSRIKFSLEDLEQSIIKRFKDKDIQQKIDEKMEKLKQTDHSSAECILLLKEIQELKKELKKKKGQR